MSEKARTVPIKFAALFALLLFSSAANAQKSGLLLGFDSDAGYYTLWIAPKVEIRRLQGVIVPRNDGFWRIDRLHTCNIQRGTAYEDSTVFINRREILTLKRMDRDSTFQLGGYEGMTPINPVSEETECNQAEQQIRMERDTVDETEECYRSSMRLTYASPSYLSYTQHESQSEFCSPDKYYSEESRTVVDGKGESQLLKALMTPARAEALQSFWEAERGECTGDEEPDDWSIERGRGRWETFLLINTGRFCIGFDQSDVLYPELLPSDVARTENVARWRAEIERRWPSYDDAFVSPSGDVIAVIYHNTLYVYQPVAGKLGPVVSTQYLNGGSIVVSAEWATGANVQRWNRILK
jgi:hypothetical protein